MNRHTIIFFVLGIVALPGAGICQKGGTSGGGRTSTPTTPSRTPTTPTNPNTLPDYNRQSPFPEYRQSIFLSGKVVMNDGAPPPEPVVIERVCNGVPRAEGYTDLKGRFSFQLGQNRVLQDASVSSIDDRANRLDRLPGSPQDTGAANRGMPGTVSSRELMGCELRASLPGFRSDLVNLTTRRMFDNPDVGTIVLHRLSSVEGTTISATSLSAPKDARKAYEKGLGAAKKDKLPEAQTAFEKAVGIYPQYASAWYELGMTYERQKNTPQAKDAYQKAVGIDSRYVNPYLRLSALAASEGKWQDVADTTNRVLRMNGADFPQAYYFNAVANYNLGNLDAAEKSAREARKLDVQHRYPRIEQVLGAILAGKHDYSGAAEQMKAYLRLNPEASDADQVRKQLQQLEKSLTAETVAPPQ